MIHQEQFSFQATGHRHMADLTEHLAAVVGRSGVRAGVVQVFCVGGTSTATWRRSPGR
jgi:thiamine phosphate synthase YjbQ (UPF0047 family)